MASFGHGGLIEQMNITATAAGTTTLVGSTASSATLGKQIQVFTGSTTQIVVLPDATTMLVGQKFEIINQSTGALTLNFNGGAAFTDASGQNKSSIASNTSLFVILQTNSTSAGTWAVLSTSGSGLGAPGPTVQKFLSGSGTYTTPANVSFIRVQMVGGGGGGGGSGTSGGGAGGTGFNTTFGTSLLAANGAGGGTFAGSGGTGGTASLGTGPIGIASQGGAGGSGSYSGTSAQPASGYGGASPFGGAGVGSFIPGGGVSAITNTGSGGGGGSSGAGGNSFGGAGGGAGGYVDAIIVSPSATYSYVVGAAGTAGLAGTSGAAGGAGGSGIIIVTEYYFNGLGASAGNGGAYTPTVTTLTSGSGTFTTPANASFLRVRMVGGGGGGGLSGTSAGTGATAGGNTTFGTSLLVANGGGGGAWGNPAAAGGSASLGSGPIGIALQGASGGGSTSATNTSSTNGFAGGNGASSFFGGAGAGGTYGLAGFAAVTNSGSGGGGAATGTSAGNNLTGSGGSAGGFVDAIILAPAATYAYNVGTAGAAGLVNANGFNGGAGGSGLIEITTYYNNGAVGTATNVTGVVAEVNGGTGITGSVVLLANGQPANATAGNPVIYPTKLKDTHTAYSTSTGRYTVPVSGTYSVSASFAATSSVGSVAYLYKNGAQAAVIGQAAASPGVTAGSTGVSCVAGDILDIRDDTNLTSFNASVVLNQLYIVRVGS